MSRSKRATAAPGHTRSERHDSPDCQGQDPASLRLPTLMVAPGRLGAMTADLGGEQDLTEAQRQLIQRAATLGALIEDFEARFLAANSWTVFRNTYRRSRPNGTS